MLCGRDLERSGIGDLLEGARASRSAVLVILGDPGVGKSALLDDARERAEGMRVLSGSGIESEAHLPFAALHQVLRPVLDLVEQLPPPQAGALRGALGLTAGGGNDRFLISLAVLSLLAEAAEQEPLLCLVDDAHWLDDASADALVFAARRLEAEGIVMLFSAREGETRRFEAPGLPELHIGGLDPESAGMLIDRRTGDALSPEVRDRLVAEAEGNPLALLELSAALSQAQLSGAEPLLAPIPVSTRVERAFLERVHELPEQTQTLLLVAAADDTGELATVLGAAAQLGADAEALDAAERAGLAQVRETRLELRHPLVRSAVYQGAPLSRRQAIHRALADVLDGDAEADRRAWHRAAASVEPDPLVVEELEQAAARARQRSGFAAASLALERAAALTTDEERRSLQLIEAAETAWFAGRLDRALMLLERTRPLVSRPIQQADIDRWHGMIELTRGVPADAYELFFRAARDVAPLDGDRSLYLLALASIPAAYVGDREAAVEIARITAGLTVSESPQTRMLVHLLTGLGAQSEGDFARGAASLRLALETAEELGRDVTAAQPAWLLFAGRAALFLGDDEAGYQLHRRAAADARTTGALSLLTQVLPRLAHAEIGLGRWAAAAASAQEGLELTRGTGQDDLEAHLLTVLMLLAALRGDENECRSLAARSREFASARRIPYIEEFANWALAMVELGLGRAEEAVSAAARISQPPGVYWSGLDRIEAAVRAGQQAIARDWLDSFRPWAENGAAWTQAAALHCRALVSEDECETERLFVAALDAHAEATRPFERARSELAFGEFLRRTRRRVEAREHLRAALVGFETVGASLWAERARVELRASGQTARKRDPSTRAELTSQELQIARFVAQGLSNREVAAQLFLSPRTIDFHLRNVFRKLGLTSRTQLARFDLDSGNENTSDPVDPAIRPARA